jgi:hypothetical protein
MQTNQPPDANPTSPAPATGHRAGNGDRERLAARGGLRILLARRLQQPAAPEHHGGGVQVLQLHARPRRDQLPRAKGVIGKRPAVTNPGAYALGHSHAAVQAGAEGPRVAWWASAIAATIDSPSPSPL